jgi:phenylalanyl-tRNA synthetase beta chain
MQENLTQAELKNKINNHVIEVENVFPLLNSADLIVGQAIKVEKHPESQKLQIAQVDLGNETVQILCGAPNLKEGQKVIVAPNGSMLGEDFKIEKRMLAGYESNGMICGLDEILNIDSKKLKEEHLSGIVVLPEEFQVGTKLSETTLGDTIFEIGLTPNRNDLLSLVGQNNDLACLFDKQYQIPQFNKPIKPNKNYQVKLDTKDSLALNIHQFDNVKIESNIVKEIELLKYNIRSVDPVVDLSNEVMIQTGQPIHFYDADKVVGTIISVRNAVEGEKILLLNGVEYSLLATDLVICDEAGPISLAGVMGGDRTKCDENTRNILVEVASFSPKSIRKTATRTNNRSDASSRFEKGISKWNTDYAAQYLISQLEEFYVGTATIDLRTKINQEINLSISKLAEFVGQSIPKNEVVKTLNNLNFNIKESGDEIVVLAPEFLTNHETKEDVYEEIIRFYGLNNVKYTAEQNNAFGLTNAQKKIRNVESYLINNGLNEVVTYSLVSEKSNQVFNHLDTQIDQVALLHPQSQARTNMKTNNISNLLEVINYNNNRQEKNVNIFEYAKRYGFNLNEKNEENVLSIALQNEFKKEAVNFYVIREIVEEILYNVYGLTKDNVKLSETNEIKGMHPYQTVVVTYKDEYLGYLGKVMPNISKDTYVAELIIDKINDVTQDSILVVKELSKFPSTKRTFTIQTNKNIKQSEIIEVLKAEQESLIDIDFIVIFEEEDTISSTYELIYQSVDGVISSELIQSNEEKIKNKVDQKGWTIK